MDSLKKAIYDGRRISSEQALELFDWDLIELGRAADFRRRLARDDERVGFIIDRIINYTNVCEAKCDFCAYHAKAGRIAPYELTIAEILTKVGELADAGGTQVMLQGGMHPDHRLEDYLEMVTAVKERYPDIHLHSFSPSEVLHAARQSGIPLDETIARLKAAGVASVPGASDILVDSVRRKVCPKKITKDEWVEVMRTLARHDMRSSATMTYGLGETLAEKIAHFEVIRRVQDETGILMAFIPWSFSPANTRLPHIIPATGIDYLKVVAIGRIFIDNITYIQAGWLTEGLKLAQIALAMGANDMGGVLTEEVVVKATGVKTATSMPEMIELIRNAGKIPVQRDSRYSEIRSFAS